MNSETVFEKNGSSITRSSIDSSASGTRQQRELEKEGEIRRLAGELYEKLKGMELNQTDLPLNFTKRLARENLWEDEFAGRVRDEYLKFVVLAGMAGHPVTPSEAVDEAWHLHLTFTRSYWDEMCAVILGSPLHHDPTGGTDDDQRKFVDWYEDSLRSYQRIFVEAPPSDIWPDAKIRFKNASKRRIINLGEFFLIERDGPAYFWLIGAILFAAVFLLNDESEFQLYAKLGSGILLILAAFTTLRLNFWSKRNSSGQAGGGCGGCGGCGG